MSKIKHQKSYLAPLTLALAITVLGSMYIFYKLNHIQFFPKLNKPSTTSKSFPIPTRSPYPLQADQGTAGTFRISQSHKIGPVFTNFIIDPIVPQTNKDIKITVTIKSDLELKSLTAKIATDKDPIPLQMIKTQRIDNQETWTSTFKLTKPVDYTYIFNFIADDGSTNIAFDLPLRTD